MNFLIHATNMEFISAWKVVGAVAYPKAIRIIRGEFERLFCVYLQVSSIFGDIQTSNPVLRSA